MREFVPVQAASQPSQRAGQFAADPVGDLGRRLLLRYSEKLSKHLIERTDIGNFSGHQETVANQIPPADRAEGRSHRSFDSGSSHSSCRRSFAFGGSATQDIPDEGAPVGNLEVLEKDRAGRQFNSIH